MKLTYNTERKRFEATMEFHERMPFKEAGFAWDGVSRTWHADHWKEAGKHSLAKQAGMAAKFIHIADEDAKAHISAEAVAAVELEKVSLETSRATDAADVKLIAPEGLDYLPFQRAGILYALRIFGDAT